MCIFRDTCQFRHPYDQRNGSDRLRQRCGTWARYRIYNEGRAGSLRRWLVDVFGAEYLNSGSGILDVAGGKGELSFELNNLSNIRSTVVDPRPLEICGYRKKLHYGFYHNNQILGAYNVRPNPNDFSMHIIPPHLRLFFEVEAPETICTTSVCSADTAISAERAEMGYLLPRSVCDAEEFLRETKRAISTAWTKKGLIHEDDGSVEDIAVEVDGAPSEASNRSSYLFDEMEDNVVVDHTEAVRIISDCSILVGMHPDQVS